MSQTTDDHQTAGVLTPERLRQIRVVFESLITLDPVPRRIALWDARRRDPALALEVERLLSAYDHETDFLDAPIRLPNKPAAADPLADVDLAGTRVGAYEVLREIGRGGMGTVYEGLRIDGSFEKRVAIKLIRATLLTESVRERFRREQQILAGLDHPAIARILDGGTTNAGRPYFVMEYVEGTRIDRYCREHALTIEQRLALFRKVCDAVQYAHDRFIVHRDLKPANILVTPDGSVKLLDFGIAKLLSDPNTPQPAGPASALLLTPEYASPEQIHGKPITTATDVYLLGLLLFELLADVHPFRQAGQAPHETMRAIGYDDPRKPSTLAGTNKLRRQLRGELDNVVLMALQRDPIYRYTSVSRLADDLDRYTTGLPVRAHGDRVGYRTAKFLRRHALAVMAVLVIAASLGAGIVISVAEARRVQQEQRQLRSLVTTLLFDLHDGIHSLAGSGPARRLVLTTAQTYLEALSKETGGDVPLQRELATAYEKTGDLLHEAIATSADTSALDSYRKALELRTALAQQSGSTAETQRELAFSVSKVGDGHFYHGDTKEALDDYANARALAQPLVDAAPNDADARKVLGYVQNRRCIVLASAGDARNATDACLDSITQLRQALITQSSDPLIRRTLAATYATYGNLQAHLDRVPEGLQNLHRAETMFDALAAEHPNDVDYRRRIAYTQLYEAQALIQQHDRAAGMTAYSKAVTSMETLLAIDPSDAKSPTNLAFMLTKMAEQMKKDGSDADAEQAEAKAIGLLRVVAERPGSGPMEWNEYANALVHAAFAPQRQPAVALDLARRASTATKDANPRILDTLAWAYYRVGDRPAAIATEQKALSLVAASNALGQGLRQELEENLAKFQGD